MSNRRETHWGTKFGFYLAAVGSALGLGNLWRFPFVTVENGGGAFVLIYIAFVLVIGLPILIGELMLGKITRRGSIAAFRKLEHDEEIGEGTRGTFGAGHLAALACLLVVSYYAVVSGWVLHFLMQFTFGGILSSGENVDTSLRLLKDSGLLQVALASVHILISLVIVVKGVQEGIEKWVGNIMPIFVVLLGILVVKSLASGQAIEALRFQFYPDFTKLTWYSPLQALGHVFFSLSIGMGTMVAFGSYLKPETRIPSAGFRVTTLDTVISLFAGLLIFPTIMGMSMGGSGPELLFRALPRLLQGIDSGWFFGVVFFVCLYLGALGASIGLLEALVANVTEVFKVSRERAGWVVGIVTVCGTIPPALSSSGLKSVTYHGYSLFALWDTVVVNVLLPIGVLAFCLALAKKLKAEPAIAEFVNDDSLVTQKLYSHWRFVVRFVIPAIIVISLSIALVKFIFDLFAPSYS
ncbi:MAG: sodium-dependent transporter [Bdellovibrionales bacterium]|jgi:NSS family neurotransmitter:Na+ symporter|nr:sodium-dependent transporter [Bdellovibrionales bacterium]